MCLYRIYEIYDDLIVIKNEYLCLNLVCLYFNYFALSKNRNILLVLFNEIDLLLNNVRLNWFFQIFLFFNLSC